MSPPTGDLLPMPSGIQSLRSFSRAVELERCELCAAPLAESHEHLLDPGDRRLRCACTACALLFDGPSARGWLRVRTGVERLDQRMLTEADWEALGIPIGLCFFVRSATTGRITALYPGPAGLTESQLSGGAWEQLRSDHPELAALQPEVEALLVSRVGGVHRQAKVSIDLCYRLVGLIRQTWRGFGGGDQAWAAIDDFFASLEPRHA